MSKTDAAQYTGNWQNMSYDEFNNMIEQWPVSIPENLNEDYKALRNEVVDYYIRVYQKVSEDKTAYHKREYMTDLYFAIGLYDILKKYSFNVRMASNDQVWIYLSIKVFPDIVHKRYPGGKVKTQSGIEYRHVNEERFWKTKRRIYLKVLWWYIYLSMQKNVSGEEDLGATFNILKDNSTDEIVQIVERSGPFGYRVDLYRHLMKYYAEHRNQYGNKEFRKVMVLNTARTQLVEPALMECGINMYIKELFEYFDEQ